MSKSAWSALFASGMMVFFGCAGTSPPSGGNGGGGTGMDLPSTTKILNSTTLQSLQAVSDDHSTFTFTKGAAQLDSLKVGDIIVSDVSEPLLPYGTLRRVESMDESGDTVTIETGEAGLAQAVENGEIHARFPLVLEEGAGGGKLVPSMLGPGQLVFPFNNVVVFDGDKNTETTNDQILMDGNLSLEPEVIIDIEISNFTLQKATIEITGEASARVTFTAHREAVYSYEDVLLTVPFPKVVVPLGPIPVVLVPILEIRAGAEGSFSTDMAVDLKLDADTRVGMGYDGGFGPILEVDPSGTAEVTEFLDGSTADGKVWISARFKIAVYGLAGVYVESMFYGKAHVGVDECPWWTLRAGVEGSAAAYAGISAEFLIFDTDITIFEWKTDPLKEEKQIAEAEGCAPSQDGQTVANWARSYGADSLEYPVGLAVTADGGAVITGSTYSYTPDPDAYLMKVDRLGHLVWQTAFDDLRSGIAVAEIDDGYYLLAGDNDYSSFLSPPFLPSEFTSQTGDPPSFLLRLDQNGSPVWATAFGATDALDASALAILPGGDAVVAGTIGDPPDSQDIWIARFNSTGSPVWARRIDAPASSEQTTSMIVDSSGSILVLASPTDGWCDRTIKMDQDGNVIWQYCYAGDHNNWPSEIVEVPDGYMVVGDLDIHAQVNRIDYDGNLLWARHIDSDGIERDPDTGRELTPDKTPYDSAYSAAAYATGEVLIGGKTDLGAEEDFWIIRLDTNGNAEWIRSYGGNREEATGGYNEFNRPASTIAVTPDGGALFAGYTASFSHAVDAEDFDFDVWIVKVRSLGTVDLDAESGAFAVASGGEVDTEIQHTRQTLTSPAVSLDLLTTAFTPVVYSPNFDVTRQGGAE